MSEQFWHDVVIEKSFVFLQEFVKRFQFVLIGGWAVYFHTKALKSKDIDIIVTFEELEKLRTQFDLIKNERLKKYEIKADGFDIDIYVPHYSDLGMPLDDVMRNTISIEGFRVPRKETLLALKLHVYEQRKGSLKGKKDMIDVISLLYYGNLPSKLIQDALGRYHPEVLSGSLREILSATYEVKELRLNRKTFADFKKPLLAALE
jgi:hypothetical protein